LLEKLRQAALWVWDRIVKYAVKFGTIGAIGFVLDATVFNALRLGVLGKDHFFQGPIGATIVSTGLAIIFNWLGNRYWTFRARRRRDWFLEFVEYAAVSVAGSLIALGVLWISHYALGFESLVADNIAKNVIGLGLGTIVRFGLYRYWVYGHHRSEKFVAATKVEEAEIALFEEPPAAGDVGGHESPAPSK
jgi:putative flippase GtrA